MPKIAANLQFLFNEYDVLDRYDAAARAGFAAVELQNPYGLDRDAVAERLARNGLKQVLINMPPGNAAAGERGIAILPGREAEFQDYAGQAAEWARVLGCEVVNCMSGATPPGADRERLYETLVGNLKFAAAEFASIGVKVTSEALNTRDNPGFFLTNTAQVLKLIRDVGHPNLGIQYDVYHMQVMEGDIARTIAANVGRIWHMQIADTPGRREPGTGEINYDFLLPYLDEVGYAGWVSAEYRPSGRTEAGLGWAARYLRG